MLVKLPLPLRQEPARQRRVILVALVGCDQRVLNLLNHGADRQGQILGRHRGDGGEQDLRVRGHPQAGGRVPARCSVGRKASPLSTKVLGLIRE